MATARIILTADRSLMSEYRNNIFFGFSTSAPRGFIPDWFFYRFVCRQVDATSIGEATLAPYPIRKLEAILLAGGFARSDIVVAHPDHLESTVSDDTKVIAMSVMDPLGTGPVTSTLVGLFGGESYTAQSFKRLMSSVNKVREGRPEIRVIAGGPGVWQLSTGDFQNRYGIDTLFYGEAESPAPSLFKDAVDGRKLPKVIHGKPVPIENSPDIVAPSICGLIEVSRGCGRGCKFCSTGMSKLRSKRLDRILAEAKTNIRFGKTNIILHGEDVFRYGAKGLKPNVDAVAGLFESVFNLPGLETLNISHGAFASVLATPPLLPRLSEIMGLDENNWKAYEVGLETGSPRLVKSLMAAKCKPFKPDNWPEIVKQATAISNDAHWMPVATLVMGLPGETGDDVTKTLELVDDLESQWIMMYPLFFVPLGSSVNEEFFSKDKILQEHFELFFRCWEINLNQFKNTFAEIMPYTNYSRWERILMQVVLGRSVTAGLRGIEVARLALQEGKGFRLGRNLHNQQGIGPFNQPASPLGQIAKTKVGRASSLLLSHPLNLINKRIFGASRRLRRFGGRRGLL